MNEIPIIVSMISLLVSLYTLWASRIAKFKLEVVSTGRVDLTSNPNSPGARQAAVILQLLLTNSGARLGYVNDIAIVLQKIDAQGQSVVFRSLYEMTEDTLNLTDRLPPPKLTTFNSFPIKPGETVVKKIVFVPLRPRQDVTFENGRYLITPFTMAAKSERWQNWRGIQLVIVPADLQSLNNTTVTPTPQGGQFIKWMVHSKPAQETEEFLLALENKVVKGYDTFFHGPSGPTEAFSQTSAMSSAIRNLA